jgi:hypothetical protein
VENRAVKQGKYLHVEGSPLKGFVFQIVRGWDTDLTRSRPFDPIELGRCKADLINWLKTRSHEFVSKKFLPQSRRQENQ